MSFSPVNSLKFVQILGSSRFRQFVIYSATILFVATAYFNVGIVALDDYHEGISRYIPASKHSIVEVIDTAGFRNPIPNVFFLSLSKLVASVGVLEPVNQLRGILVILGLISLCFFIPLSVRFFQHEAQEDRRVAMGSISLFLLCLYFVSPFFFTRALIEGISAPWLLLSAYGAYQYSNKGDRKYISIAVWSLCVASVFRMQAGALIVGLVWLVYRRNPKDLWTLAFHGLSAFLLTGLLDLAMRGEFHYSVRAYVSYNMKYSSNHGTSPFWVFPLLFFGLTLPPSLIGRYKKLAWDQTYRPLWPLIIYFVLFLVSHSLVPHKEDRFMVPIIPVFLVLLVPLIHYWLFIEPSRSRILYFLSVNCTLLFLASFSIAQANVVKLAVFVDQNPSIERVVGISGTLGRLFPTAFINRAINTEHIDYPNLDLKTENSQCNTVFALTPRDESSKRFMEENFKYVTRFNPGPLEWLMVILNNRPNALRGPLFVYRGKGC